MSKLVRRRAKDDRGAALAEMALVLPLLLLVLFGMLDFGKAFNEWLDETHLANDGARLAAVSYCPDLAATDCGWAAKGCPAAAVSSGPLACIAWYTGRGANVKELKPRTSGGTLGRAGNAYAPAQNAARVCVWFPEATYTAGTSCISTCNASPTSQIRPGDRIQVIVTVRYQWLNYLGDWLSVASTPITGKASMRLEALMPGLVSNPTRTGCYPAAPAGT